MTATDELRRLLDERGVEYDGKTYEGVTFWNEDTNMAVASEGYDGKLWVSQSLTPEQAVEATLGRWTCHVECFDDGMDEGLDGEWFAYATATWHLSCGHEVYGTERPRYCPNCGRRIEQ